MPLLRPGAAVNAASSRAGITVGTSSRWARRAERLFAGRGHEIHPRLFAASMREKQTTEAPAVPRNRVHSVSPLPEDVLGRHQRLKTADEIGVWETAISLDDRTVR